MAEVSVAVLGLNRVGASICLALKRYNAKPNAANKFNVTAFGTDAESVKQAKDRGLAARVVSNAGDAVNGADIIIVALTYGELEGAYNYIGRDIRAGAVILDFSPIKRDSAKFADKHLQKDAHFVGMTAVINPRYILDALDDTEAGAEDYFDGGVIYLMPGVKCIPAAVDLAGDFATVLGAQVKYVDMNENDVLIAATETMPKLLGAMYYFLLSRNKGWEDNQRVTNASFGMLTQALLNTHPDDLTLEAMQNRDALVRYLDDFALTLKNLRDVLAENDQDAVGATLTSAAKDYEGWINRRTNNRWEDDRTPQASEAPGIMSTLFGGYVASRLRSKKDPK